MTTFKYTNMITLTQSMIDSLSYFEEALKVTFDHGHKQFVLVTGENATGKSFIRRLYHAVIAKRKIDDKKVEVIHLSQQGRSSSGMMSSLVYGDESYNSTGYLTSRTVLTGIKTCIERDTPHYIIWDEPDIGLSSKYAGAVGVKIREFVQNLPKLTKGVVVVSHNKSLAKQLLPINPSHLRLGDCPDLKTWLNTDDEPGDLEELQVRNHKTFQSILSILKNKD